MELFLHLRSLVLPRRRGLLRDGLVRARAAGFHDALSISGAIEDEGVLRSLDLLRLLVGADADLHDRRLVALAWGAETLGRVGVGEGLLAVVALFGFRSEVCLRD